MEVQLNLFEPHTPANDKATAKLVASADFANPRYSKNISLYQQSDSDQFVSYEFNERYKASGRSNEMKQKLKWYGLCVGIPLLICVLAYSGLSLGSEVSGLINQSRVFIQANIFGFLFL